MMAIAAGQIAQQTVNFGTARATVSFAGLAPPAVTANDALPVTFTLVYTAVQ